MPIDRERFERGSEVEDVQEMVQDYLYDNPGQAFTVPEIADEIGNPDLARDQVSDQTETLTEYQLDLVAVKAVLINLNHRGAVRSRYVEADQGTQIYYKGISDEESPGRTESDGGRADG